MALCYRKGVEDGKHSIRLKDLVARDVSVDNFPALSTVWKGWCTCGILRVNVSRIVGSMVRWHAGHRWLILTKSRDGKARGQQKRKHKQVLHTTLAGAPSTTFAPAAHTHTPEQVVAVVGRHDRYVSLRMGESVGVLITQKFIDVPPCPHHFDLFENRLVGLVV